MRLIEQQAGHRQPNHTEGNDGMACPCTTGCDPNQSRCRARLACSATSIETGGEPDQYDFKEPCAARVVRVKCWGAVTLTLAERNLCAKNTKQRAASVDYMKNVVTMVKELEGTEITIVPSTVGKIIPDGTPDEEWTWAVESLKEIYEHANKAGVVIAIEALNRFETHFITRGEQALALADAVAPDVGVCLDCFT